VLDPDSQLSAPSHPPQAGLFSHRVYLSKIIGCQSYPAKPCPGPLSFLEGDFKPISDPGPLSTLVCVPETILPIRLSSRFPGFLSVGLSTSCITFSQARSPDALPPPTGTGLGNLESSHSPASSRDYFLLTDDLCYLFPRL
jgi:hypothetical protein